MLCQSTDPKKKKKFLFLCWRINRLKYSTSILCSCQSLYMKWTLLLLYFPFPLVSPASKILLCFQVPNQMPLLVKTSLITASGVNLALLWNVLTACKLLTDWVIILFCCNVLPLQLDYSFLRGMVFLGVCQQQVWSKYPVFPPVIMEGITYVI